MSIYKKNLTYLLQNETLTPPLRVEKIEQLLNAVKNLKDIENLILDNLKLTDEQLPYLLKLVVFMPQLRVINLVGNYLTQASVNILLEFIAKPVCFNLQKVFLAHNPDILNSDSLYGNLKNRRQKAYEQGLFQPKRHADQAPVTQSSSFKKPKKA